jgi:hypothetical protein
VPVNRLNKRLIAAAIAAVFSSAIVACGDSGSDQQNPSVPNAKMNFNRVSTFNVCTQVGASCESDAETAAEIVAASEDGRTLIYTNSPKGEIGFVDIADPANPVGIGQLDMGGEPTSVAVLGKYALVAVNTRADYVNTSGKLVVVDIASQQVVTSIELGGQPDSVARSPDGRYVAVAIENERDEDLGEGTPPQMPAGYLVVVDAVGTPATWKTRRVELTGLQGMLYNSDPEPEYIDINSDNIAAITLQENNHIALVDLKAGAVVNHFSAGSVSLSLIDTVKNGIIELIGGESISPVLREPDGITWISTRQFVTANEGDMDGGSRSYTVWNTDGTVAYEAGNSLEHLVASIGHTNEERSAKKGGEPENATFGRFEGTDYLFVASERSSVVSVFDMSDPNRPQFKQVLPSGIAPEGIRAIPGRNLLVAANELDDRAVLARSSLSIYEYQSAASSYPTIKSVNRVDGTPIPWGALSGLAAAPTGNMVYSIEDSFYKKSRIFEIDVSSKPASLVRDIRITDPQGLIAGLDPALAALVNSDGTVNLDPEGISIASSGGFWVVSEGKGNDAMPNLVLKVSSAGVIEQVIDLPADVKAKQLKWGYEGIAEANGKLVLAFQRAWTGDDHPRIGIYDLASGLWTFAFYPLDPSASPLAGDWVGLSDIAHISGNNFLVIERDKGGGPDARIKRLYRVDLSGVTEGTELRKVLVRDLMSDLAAPGGNIPEKIEGLAIRSNGDVLIVNDNDGVTNEESSGETQLLNLGKILN